MAIGGRPRNNKRNSSSSSYTSTITTISFITLCVVGVWMLTSNPVVPPQTTTRTGKLTTTSSTSDTSDVNEALISEPVIKKDSPVFEDSPGDLPTDAIKSDDPKSNEESEKEQIIENEKQETDGEGGTNNDESVQQDLKGKELAAEEKETQAEKETRISEENTMTENQQAEQTLQESSLNEGNNNNQNQYESGGETYSPDLQATQIPDNQNQQDQQSTRNDEQQENSGQDSQNLKSFEERQQKQRLEDAGVLSGASNSPESTENDQIANENSKKNNVKQQQQQKPQQQLNDAETVKTEMKQETTTQTDLDKANESSFPGGGAIPKESKESKKSWSTQATESENQKERRKDESEDGKESIYGYTWQLCNVTAGPDYIPCLDNEKALRQLHSTKHFEHRERHCPEEGPPCLVPAPEGYKRPITWPQSRDKIWYHNVPHTKLAVVKGHQNWVKVTGEFLTFPGGGTQFIHGALHYIDFVQEAVPTIAWGKRTRVILDVGCGVASFGGYLFERDVLTMSFAPKDEHEAQVQFALERGIPAISAVMGSKRLPFPSMVFDFVHCARCRVPWHEEGGLLLLELNRVLRPGGYFVWSATPVYQKLKEDVEIWEAMSALTASMCWELVTIKKDQLNSVGAAIYRKPSTNDCYDQRKQNRPPMCKNDDDPNAAWYVRLQACMHRVPIDETQRGSKWPEQWPSRLQTPPYWLNSSQMGIYGKPAPQDFGKDYEHWKHVVSKTYMKNVGISWSNVRNVMDMRAVYGGFAAALKDLQVWVLNVVNVDSPDTLPIIYERGLFGIYHDWCESFSTYPRTYDLLHADHLFSILKKRCKLPPVLAEIDRIARPGGKLIVRDESAIIGEVENLLKSLHWEVTLTFSKDQEGLLSAQKGDWRPQTFAASA